MSRPSFVRNKTFTLERGLYLLEQRGGKTYAARAWVNGKWEYSNLETDDYTKAEKSALVWYRRLMSSLKAGPEGETMDQAAKTFIASIRKPDRQADYEQRWKTTREFWHDPLRDHVVYVRDVDSPKLLEFVNWRKERMPDITASTLHKDLVRIRRVLKHAVMRGAIPTIPLFPGSAQIGSIQKNPRPWLELHEWRHFQEVALKRIADADNVRTKRQREELLAFCQWLVHTAMRVDEARSIRVKDVRVKTAQHSPVNAAHLKKATARTVEFLEITISKSKTGARVATSRPAAVAVFKFMSEGKRPNDLLFPTHHRDASRELLIAAGLRESAFGRRNLKAFRATGIAHWILAHPGISLKFLASNAGTSVNIIDQFYAARLGVSMDATQWL
jgi:integrase